MREDEPPTNSSPKPTTPPQSQKDQQDQQDSNSYGKARLIPTSNLPDLQTVITIDSIEIKFPYKPYPAQLAYMSEVISALNGKSNAILESPTGTGKTLCLLCATLAWLAFKRKQEFEQNICSNCNLKIKTENKSDSKNCKCFDSNEYESEGMKK